MQGKEDVITNKMTMKITIYEKSTCSKCSMLNTLLSEKGMQYKTVNFHTDKIRAEKLLELATKCNLPLAEMIRTGESIYSELQLDTKELTITELAEVMVANPDLIQRPIIETEEQAIIGRAPHDFISFIDTL